MLEEDRMSQFEYKNTSVWQWKDLEEKTYNNHFTNGQCYLKVEFPHAGNDSLYIRNLPIYPDDITFSGSTNYASADILGRPGPIAGYVNTSDVTSRIQLHLHRELVVLDDTSENNTKIQQVDRNRIDDIVALVQACAYPKIYQDGMYVPIVTYVFGDTTITGKQTSWNVKWGGPKIGKAYMEVTIDVSISHAPMGILDFNTMYENEPRKFK